jgi:hypothetical protein
MRVSQLMLGSILILATSAAFADFEDVTDRVQTLSCKIPSDDQNGTATLSRDGARPPSFELRYTSGVHSKLVDYPLQLITLDPADGTLTLQVQHRVGDDVNAYVHKDGTGEFQIQQGKAKITILMTECQIAME